MQPQLGQRDGRDSDEYRKPDRAAPHERNGVGQVLGGAGDHVAVIADERRCRSEDEEKHRVRHA